MKVLAQAYYSELQNEECVKIKLLGKFELDENITKDELRDLAIAYSKTHYPNCNDLEMNFIL